MQDWGCVKWSACRTEHRASTHHHVWLPGWLLWIHPACEWKDIQTLLHGLQSLGAASPSYCRYGKDTYIAVGHQYLVKGRILQPSSPFKWLPFHILVTTNSTKYHYHWYLVLLQNYDDILLCSLIVIRSWTVEAWPFTSTFFKCIDSPFWI